jgi:hypothetical protein
MMQSLCESLADAGISVFAISTFDSDYLFIKPRIDRRESHPRVAIYESSLSGATNRIARR